MAKRQPVTFTVITVLRSVTKGPMRGYDGLAPALYGYDPFYDDFPIGRYNDRWHPTDALLEAAITRFELSKLASIA